MAASITESSGWVNRMKAHFASMDIDKNGRVNDDDVAILAKKLAAYRKEGKESEKRYFDTLRSVLSYGIQGRVDGVNENEFVEGMKKFVTQPDARERVNAYAAAIFEVVDQDKNGVLSFDEFLQFHRASNTKFDEGLAKRIFEDADTNGDGVIHAAPRIRRIAREILPVRLMRPASRESCRRDNSEPHACIQTIIRMYTCLCTDKLL